jgi:hypothetical protein
MHWRLLSLSLRFQHSKDIDDSVLVPISQPRAVVDVFPVHTKPAIRGSPAILILSEHRLGAPIAAVTLGHAQERVNVDRACSCSPSRLHPVAHEDLLNGSVHVLKQRRWVNWMPSSVAAPMHALRSRASTGRSRRCRRCLLHKYMYAVRFDKEFVARDVARDEISTGKAPSRLENKSR